VGSVYRPKDLLKGKGYIIKKGLEDITPGMTNQVINILESWEGKASEKKLIDLLGENKARKVVERLKP
jgi:hypothetical protein